MRTLWATVAALTVLGAGTAIASAASGTPNGAGGQAPPATSSTASSSAAATAQAPVGSSVTAAVYAAHQQDVTGRALANSIHEVQYASHPKAKGLAVAMAVYAQKSADQQGSAALTVGNGAGHSGRSQP